MTLNTADADEAEPEEDEVCGQFSLCIRLMMSLKECYHTGEYLLWWRYLDVICSDIRKTCYISCYLLHLENTRGSHYTLQHRLPSCGVCMATFMKHRVCHEVIGVILSS